MEFLVCVHIVHAIQTAQKQDNIFKETGFKLYGDKRGVPVDGLKRV